jgi:predicted nucleic acid-binding Zn ribbon protein
MASSGNTPAPSPTKLCIACKEPIPVDAEVCFHCQTRQTLEKESGSKTILKWVGVVTAAIGLITGLSGVVGPLKGWWTQGRQAKTMLATAQQQEELGEYSASLDTLSEILKNDQGNTQALHTRLDVAMLWVEHTRTPRRDLDAVAPQAKAIFDRLSPVLEAGLGNAKDYRAADVVAHLGWLNLLKMRIVGESGPVETHIHHALQMDPDNVYANAMLGEWLLLTHDSLEQSRQHFATALKTGKARDFVRGCQLEGMIYDDDPGVPAELIRVANQMRKDHDPISDDDRGRIHSYYSTVTGSDAELREVVSAVPPDEAWATYEWVSPPEAPASVDTIEQRFIRANIDEAAGQRSDALQIYRGLETDTKDSKSRVAQRVRDALRRLGS